ncbi:MAG: 2-oxo acid dehydrogenase subunit E2, partial [Nocardioidaceae bacterium]
MAESSQDASPADNPLAEFGANEWLVDEMFERYQQDPNSVGKQWWDFFKDYEPDESGNGGTAPTLHDSRGGEQESKAKQSAGQPETKQKARSADQPVDDQPGKAPNTGKPDANPTRSTDARKRADDTPTAPSTTKPVPKEPQKTPPSTAQDEPQRTVLRGAPARTVQNMDVSLTVPTATSVRAVPVKLLIDNRIVINNHLSRARGGKVSFTHIIGFALVRALRTMPEMNNGFEVVDGKPNLVAPAHVNLGLAIDLPKPDGTRQLVVP